MTKLLVLFGCSLRPSTTPAPPDGTVEASRHHRPAWAASSSYAPSPPAEVLALGEAWVGPVENGLVTCAMETTYRGDRQGFLASLMNHDTRSPDTDGLLWPGGGGYVLTSAASNSSRGRFGASKVNLDEGDPLRLTLNDRGLFRSHQYDELTGTYAGQLPLTLRGETSSAECTLVPSAVVDQHVDTAMRSCEPGFEAMADRTPDLQAEDMGRGLAVNPRPSVEAMAGLVGWDDVRVRERVERIRREDERFQTELGLAMVAHRPQMVARADTGTLSVEPLPMDCPRFGYRKHGVWSDCGVEILWTRQAESTDSLELYDGEGHLVSTPYLWVAADAPKGEERQWAEPPAGRQVRMVMTVDDPSPPYQMRLLSEQGIEWITVGCTGAGC